MQLWMKNVLTVRVMRVATYLSTLPMIRRLFFKSSKIMVNGWKLRKKCLLFSDYNAKVLHFLIALSVLCSTL